MGNKLGKTEKSRNRCQVLSQMVFKLTDDYNDFYSASVSFLEQDGLSNAGSTTKWKLNAKEEMVQVLQISEQIW